MIVTHITGQQRVYLFKVLKRSAFPQNYKLQRNACIRLPSLLLGPIKRRDSLLPLLSLKKIFSRISQEGWVMSRTMGKRKEVRRLHSFLFSFLSIKCKSTTLFNQIYPYSSHQTWARQSPCFPLSLLSLFAECENTDPQMLSYFSLVSQQVKEWGSEAFCKRSRSIFLAHGIFASL